MSDHGVRRDNRLGCPAEQSSAARVADEGGTYEM